MLFLVQALLIDPTLDLTSATMMLDNGLHSFSVRIRRRQAASGRARPCDQSVAQCDECDGLQIAQCVAARREQSWIVVRGGCTECMCRAWGGHQIRDARASGTRQLGLERGVLAGRVAAGHRLERPHGAVAHSLGRRRPTAPTNPTPLIPQPHPIRAKISLAPVRSSCARSAGQSAGRPFTCVHILSRGDTAKLLKWLLSA